LRSYRKPRRSKKKNRKEKDFKGYLNKMAADKTRRRVCLVGYAARGKALGHISKHTTLKHPRIRRAKSQGCFE